LKSYYPEHADTVIERKRDDVARAHCPARGRDARSVHPDVPRAGQSGRDTAGADQASMPKPFVNALAIKVVGHSAALFRFGFELGFQCGELGKGRIRIWHGFALLPFSGPA
jgi:hypothetical protein